ncbi:hypothetical protein BV22DRAFT_1040351 [Leucogyrophana mollusca]|uniref:Uncharacterized protein n=1 Tax=Leucogyrophana mollusca TaxID=85980 RepID=A0ACB8B462_9AGAM|nr:hypothetical protein BV22DRAFT_1040351 [Leucogyrophana mollusca]
MVFEQGVKNQDREYWDPSPLELVLLSVSRHWRNVALSAPGLWCEIIVAPQQPLSILRAYLERSSQSKLAINLSQWNQAPNSSLDQQLNIVLAHAHRFCALRARGVGDGPLDAIFARFADVDFSALEHVLVHAQPHVPMDGDDKPKEFSLLLLPARSLRSLSLQNMILSQIPTSLSETGLPRLSSLVLETTSDWLDLTRHMIPYALFRQFLRAAPNLSFLKLCGRVVDFRVEDGVLDAIEIPFLETLVLDSSGSICGPFIDALSAPSLLHLEYPFQALPSDLGVEHEPSPKSRFLDGGIPKYPNVRTLYLHNTVEAELHDAASYTLAFPNVACVDLGGSDVQAFATTLCDSTSEPWKKLERICVRDLRVGSLCKLYAWLEKRAKGDKKIYVTVEGDVGWGYKPGDFEADLEKLLQCQSATVDVRVPGFPSTSS